MRKGIPFSHHSREPAASGSVSPSVSSPVSFVGNAEELLRNLLRALLPANRAVAQLDPLPVANAPDRLRGRDRVRSVKSYPGSSHTVPGAFPVQRRAIRSKQRSLMSPGSYASIRLPTLTVPRICEKVIPRICRETFPAVRPQALLWIEKRSLRLDEQLRENTLLYLQRRSGPVLDRHTDSGAGARRWNSCSSKYGVIVPVPTPIRTALQTVVRHAVG